MQQKYKKSNTKKNNLCNCVAAAVKYVDSYMKERNEMT